MRNLQAIVRSRAALFLFVFLCGATLSQLRAQTCGSIVFTPPGSNVSHQGLSLTDPSGQQRAIFDLTWGGALASLTYNGVEQMVSKNTGTMGQLALWGPKGNGNWYYNPTMAGDAFNRPTPLLGAICVGDIVEIWGGTTEYSAGLYGGAETAYNVWAGQLSAAYMTPYVIHYSGHFVRNTGGGPAYYLKLSYYIWNTDFGADNVGSFLATAYTPNIRPKTIGYPSNCVATARCPANTTPTLALGAYTDTSYTNGLAIATSPSTYFTDGGAVTFWTMQNDPGDAAYAAQLWTTPWSSRPNSPPRLFVWYVLVGDWAHALTFAQSNH